MWPSDPDALRPGGMAASKGEGKRSYTVAEKSLFVGVRNDVSKGRVYDQNTRELTTLITKEGDV